MQELATSLNLKNVEFIGRLADYNDVLKNLMVGDIMLGMFAASGRGHWIIPNKIFEGMVFGKAILTADTPAIHELLTDRENVLFCKAGDSVDLASKIMELYRNDELREKIGIRAINFFKQNLLPRMLVKNFLMDLEKHV
jgi:glycosyltransferase involved in cell wall biosynthesis